ncbi:hypothetical protein F441_07700 [Phytophthora nicotianae CJ01A1]|nr:hypothetical protein L915_07547 [Phytophthora nicotianae]ETP18031.1 hypothetical protein F441_07700 [Phytophthora nicotianae CJ01A1]
MFNQFLALLARQPAPSEEPTPARMTTGETADATMSTPRAWQGDAFSFDALRPSLPLASETQGEVSTVTPAGATFDTRRTTRHPSSTPASTPVGMPMAAIPSYGGVTIQVPGTSTARHA